MYIAYCPELDVVSCGKSIEEAGKNLLEVIEIQLEETARLGTLETFLEEAGYDLNTSQPTLQHRAFQTHGFTLTSKNFVLDF